MRDFLETCVIWGLIWLVGSICAAATWQAIVHPHRPRRAPSDLDRALTKGR